jgi:hypothetical protein
MVRPQPHVIRISELIFEFGVPTHPYNAPQLPECGDTRRTETRTSAHSLTLPGRGQRSYTIFEGTSEIQRLVIARAISGVHVR